MLHTQTTHTHIPRKRKKLVNGFREGRHGAPAGYIKWEESKLINTVRKTFFLFFVFFFFPSSSLISIRNARQHNNGQCRKECLAPETERSGATIDLLPIHLNPLWPVLDKNHNHHHQKKLKEGEFFSSSSLTGARVLQVEAKRRKKKKKFSLNSP